MYTQYIKHHIDNDHVFKELTEPTSMYIQKEVPNILLFWDDSDHEERVYLDCVSHYLEEYDNITGWKIVIVVAAMQPEDYIKLTNLHNQYFKMKTDEIWRNGITGKDERLEAPVRYFNRLSIKHKVCSEGELTDWYITLYQSQPKPVPAKENILLEDVKL